MEHQEIIDWLAAEGRASEHPYVRQVTVAARDEIESLRAAVERVRELHKPRPSRATRAERVCSHSDNWYPCATVRALDGEA